jgi:hypothetical protein
VAEDLERRKILTAAAGASARDSAATAEQIQARMGG